MGTPLFGSSQKSVDKGNSNPVIATVNGFFKW